jgi:hypothetical protein
MIPIVIVKKKTHEVFIKFIKFFFLISEIADIYVKKSQNI